MSADEVTTEGSRGARPGAEAVTGAPGRTGVPPGGGGGARRRRRRREPEPEFRSYYDLPVINKPVWAAPDIAGYLFLGGLAGAGAVIGAAAQATGRPVLARTLKITAAGAGHLSLVALVHDLGRPGRFLNMLRVVKVTSPMSVGSWLLAGFVPAATAAALCDTTGVLPAAGTAATAGAALLGPAVATYTAALISNTAVPAWHDGHRWMPFLFAASALSAGAGVGLAAAPRHETGPLVPLAATAGLAEVALLRTMERRTGIVGETFRRGGAGRLLRAAEALAVGGAALLALPGRTRRRTAVAGAALVLGSALTRFGVFEAGVASAEDPRYTVVPQRERLRRRPDGDAR
jgi:hypothetical protein